MAIVSWPDPVAPKPNSSITQPPFTSGKGTSLKVNLPKSVKNSYRDAEMLEPWFGTGKSTRRKGFYDQDPTDYFKQFWSEMGQKGDEMWGVFKGTLQSIADLFTKVGDPYKGDEEPPPIAQVNSKKANTSILLPGLTYDSGSHELRPNDENPKGGGDSQLETWNKDPFTGNVENSLMRFNFSEDVAQDEYIPEYVWAIEETLAEAEYIPEYVWAYDETLPEDQYVPEYVWAPEEGTPEDEYIPEYVWAAEEGTPEDQYIPEYVWAYDETIADPEKDDRKTTELNPEEPISPLRPKKDFDKKEVVGIKPRDSVDLINMTPAEAIYHIGPDFMLNKWDAFWLWNPLTLKKELDVDYGSGEKDWMRPEWLTDYEKDIVNHKGFCVRIGSVKLPSYYNDEYEVDFLESKIKKLKSMKVNNNETSFSFRIDSNLFWLDQFELMAGRNSTIITTQKDGSDFYTRSSNRVPGFEGGQVRVIDGPDSYRKLFKTIAKTWSSSTPSKIRDYGLCLIVKMGHLMNDVDPSRQRTRLPFVVFENCKILGSGDTIDYQREDSTIQDVTVDFIFRRSYIVDPYIKASTDNSTLSEIERVATEIDEIQTSIWGIELNLARTMSAKDRVELETKLAEKYQQLADRQKEYSNKSTESVRGVLDYLDRSDALELFDGDKYGGGGIMYDQVITLPENMRNPR